MTGERKDVSLCPPGLRYRRQEWGEDVGSENAVVGVDVIQLGYGRIRCIFNHGAGVPGVTVAPP